MLKLVTYFFNKDGSSVWNTLKALRKCCRTTTLDFTPRGYCEYKAEEERAMISLEKIFGVLPSGLFLEPTVAQKLQVSDNATAS